MTSVDKDFRFMATNDLMTELKNDSIKLDDDSERKVLYSIPFNIMLLKVSQLSFLLNQIVKTLLKLLEDKNGEVQNLAVKWYIIL